MELKIITKEEAAKMGLNKRVRNDGIKMPRAEQEYVYGAIGKLVKDKDGKDVKGDTVEFFRVHRKTGVKEIIQETDTWKKIKLDNLKQK